MKKLFFLHLLYFFLSLTKADQALFDGYKPLSNNISSSKLNVLEKHAASVKCLKLEVPVEIKNMSPW